MTIENPGFTATRYKLGCHSNNLPKKNIYITGFNEMSGTFRILADTFSIYQNITLILSSYEDYFWKNWKVNYLFNLQNTLWENLIYNKFHFADFFSLSAILVPLDQWQMRIHNSLGCKAVWRSVVTYRSQIQEQFWLVTWCPCQSTSEYLQYLFTIFKLVKKYMIVYNSKYEKGNFY